MALRPGTPTAEINWMAWCNIRIFQARFGSVCAKKQYVLGAVIFRLNSVFKNKPFNSRTLSKRFIKSSQNWKDSTYVFSQNFSFLPFSEKCRFNFNSRKIYKLH